MSTHIAAKPGQIAETVLLPGDPLRAEWIANTYLDDVSCYSRVRNMLGFTGTYRGRPVSVQGTGMGQPSLAIYLHELLTEYGAGTLVRVGSCGALVAHVNLRDLVIAMTAGTDSAMNRLRFEGIDFAPAADYGLLRAAADGAAAAGMPHHVGPIVSGDSFYNDRPELTKRLAEYGVLAVEMEASALYTLAAKHGARALAICTVSDPPGDWRAHDRAGARTDVRRHGRAVPRHCHRSGVDSSLITSTTGDTGRWRASDLSGPTSRTRAWDHASRAAVTG